MNGGAKEKATACGRVSGGGGGGAGSAGDGWCGGVGGGGVRERVLVNGANVGNDEMMKKARRVETTETRGLRERQRKRKRLL